MFNLSNVAKPKLISILSSNYSGSTALSLYLARHLKDSFLIGEPALIYRVGKDGRFKHAKFCNKCESKNETCPVWDQKFVNQLRAKSGEFSQLLRSKIDKSVLVDSSKNIDWVIDLSKQIAQRFTGLYKQNGGRCIL